MTIDQAFIDTARFVAQKSQYRGLGIADVVTALCDEIERLWLRERELLAANNAELERRRVLDSENSQLLAEQRLVRVECIRQRERAELLAEWIDGLPVEIPAEIAVAMDATFPEAPAA